MFTSVSEILAASIIMAWRNHMAYYATTEKTAIFILATVRT
jgi:hypothetical protein